MSHARLAVSALASVALFASPATAFAAKPDPVKVKADAQAAATAAGLACQVTEASNPGKAGADPVYEVACADAPGWLIIASATPQSFNCLAIAASVAAGGTASSQCALPANQDGAAAMKGFAVRLGISCTIDQGVWVGRVPNEADRYEIGCANGDGAWVEADLKGAPVKKIECLEVIAAGRDCKFTTEAERLASFKARLAGSPASGCDVSQVRIAGDTATDRFYEVACRGAAGMMVSFNRTSGAFTKNYDCAASAGVAGGCKLTTAAPAGGRP